MVVAVAFAGRSISVAWWSCPNEEWSMGLVDLITEMLGWVRDAMDELGGNRKAIVAADMGIGNSPKSYQRFRGRRKASCSWLQQMFYRVAV